MYFVFTALHNVSSQREERIIIMQQREANSNTQSEVSTQREGKHSSQREERNTALCVKTWRKRRSFTALQAADYLGVKLRTFMSWEYGHRKPPKMLDRLIDALEAHE
jgi:DNA-binding transcriptional regulator YiaG